MHPFLPETQPSDARLQQAVTKMRIPKAMERKQGSMTEVRLDGGTVSLPSASKLFSFVLTSLFSPFWPLVKCHPGNAEFMVLFVV